MFLIRFNFSYIKITDVWLHKGDCLCSNCSLCTLLLWLCILRCPFLQLLVTCFYFILLGIDDFLLSFFLHSCLLLSWIDLFYHLIRPRSASWRSIHFFFESSVSFFLLDEKIKSILAVENFLWGSVQLGNTLILLKLNK